MHIAKLQDDFITANNRYSAELENILLNCSCDDETKGTILEIAKLSFDAIAETQDAIIEYLNQH